MASQRCLPPTTTHQNIRANTTQELYEPLWDELLQRSKSQGFRIRSIWIADVAHQGASSVLNEDVLGNSPSWFDHPRDLLHMINHFRAEMPRPLIGIGHSMGGAHLINLALLHPRLLETLVLIDPVAARVPSKKGNWGPAAASVNRRDRWPSRAEAEASFKKSAFYQTWDPRVLSRWLTHGLRDLPTKLYPDAQPSPSLTGASITLEPTITPNTPANATAKEVTLTTTKHQEVMTFTRPYSPTDEPAKVLHPEIPMFGLAGEHISPIPLYRAEPSITFHNLPYLRPSVQYIFGELSDLSAPDLQQEKMDTTGISVGGSGGAAAGRVVRIVVKDTGHLIPMEKVGETADICADWIGREMKRWRGDEELVRKRWEGVPEREKFTLDQRYADGFKALGLVKPPKAASPAKL